MWRSTLNAAAHAAAWPAAVNRTWSRSGPVWITEATSSVARTIDSGITPPHTPLPAVTMSGTTPGLWSMPHISPVRPNPVVTSSTTSRMPYLVHRSRSA